MLARGNTISWKLIFNRILLTKTESTYQLIHKRHHRPPNMKANATNQCDFIVRNQNAFQGHLLTLPFGPFLIFIIDILLLSLFYVFVWLRFVNLY